MISIGSRETKAKFQLQVVPSKEGRYLLRCLPSPLIFPLQIASIPTPTLKSSFTKAVFFLGKYFILYQDSAMRQKAFSEWDNHLKVFLWKSLFY